MADWKNFKTLEMHANRKRSVSYDISWAKPISIEVAFFKSSLEQQFA